MNKNLVKLIQYLSDGEFHSGAHMGKHLGITRSAVWKLIKQFSALGLEIEPITGRGYRLIDGLLLLNAKEIKNYINKEYLQQLKEIMVFEQIDSTNDYLLKQVNHNKAQICLAEQQTAGRGRFGRKWVSPCGVNIYFSMLWSFTQTVNGLSLAVAIAVVDTLAEFGIKEDIGLKWPNDILWRQRKLAGILIELTSEAYSITQAIIGIGINVNMPRSAAKEIDQPWVDISEIIGAKADRNKIVGLLINHLLQNILLFQEQGLALFLKRWRQLDILIDKTVTIITPNQQIEGVARGVDKNGYLLLEDTTGQAQTFSIGEVSVKI